MMGIWRLSKEWATPIRAYHIFKPWISGSTLTSMGQAIKVGWVSSSLAGLIRMATLLRQWILGYRRPRLSLQSALPCQRYPVSTRIAFILILLMSIMGMRVYRR